MTFETLSDLNASEGMHVVFVHVNNVTGGLFSSMFLFVVFMVIALGSFFAQQRSRGKGDFPVSASVAGLVASGAAALMLLVPGMVNPYAAVVTFVITGIAVLWMMVSSRD